MRLGMCTGVKLLQEAHAAGFDYVELPTWDLLYDQDDAAFAAVRDAVEAAPISVEACNGFIPAAIKVTGPTVDEDAVRRYMDIVLRRASEIGVSIMVFGSGGARRAPEGFPLDRALEQYTDAVRMAADIGSRYGVTIALEPLGTAECNFFNRVDQGCRIVDTVKHPNAQVLADQFHMMTVDEPLANIVAAGSRLAHVHLDMPKAFPTVSAEEAEAFPAFIQTLVQAGYDGRASIENHSFRPGDERPFSDFYTEAHDYMRAMFPVAAK